MIKKYLKRFLYKNGYKIVNLKDNSKRYPVEFNSKEREIFDFIINQKFTMVSNERLISTMLSTKYILENEIEGDFVECGVWRGGNSIAMKFLIEQYKSSKKVFLFDTFGGMTKPTNDDTRITDNTDAFEKYNDLNKDTHNEWCFSPLEEVQENFIKTGLNLENLVFVKGPVESTLNENKNLPKKISLLRLDTDWYESTKIGVEKLFPLISKNGILLLDDYGHWGGAKKAIDQYFNKNNLMHIKSYVDYTGRKIIKL